MLTNPFNRIYRNVLLRENTPLIFVPGTEWLTFHILSSEDDVISRFSLLFKPGDLVT